MIGLRPDKAPQPAGWRLDSVGWSRHREPREEAAQTGWWPQRERLDRSLHSEPPPFLGLKIRNMRWQNKGFSSFPARLPPPWGPALCCSGRLIQGCQGNASPSKQGQQAGQISLWPQPVAFGAQKLALLPASLVGHVLLTHFQENSLLKARPGRSMLAFH